MVKWLFNVLIGVISFNSFCSECRLANPTYDEMELKKVSSVYGASVVMLYKKNRQNTESHIGSAFLISARSGLYITAKHVVEKINDTYTIVALHTDYPSEQEVPVSVIVASPKHDIALLKATDPIDIPLNFRDLGNVNYREARVGQDLFAFGSGEVDSENNVRAHPATFSNWSNERSLMLVSTQIVSGDSGGPLLDKFGRVTGVFKSKIGSGVAALGEFTPSIYLDELLLESDPDDAIKELGEKITNAQISQPELAKSLQNMSNFELIMLSKVIEELQANDESTLALLEFNTFVQEDDRVENLLLPLRDGLMCIRVK